MISSNTRLRAFFVSIVTGVVGILPLSLSLSCFFLFLWFDYVKLHSVENQEYIYIYIWYLIRLNVSSFLPSLSPFLINIHSIHALRIFYVRTSTNRMNRIHPSNAMTYTQHQHSIPPPPPITPYRNDHNTTYWMQLHDDVLLSEQTYYGRFGDRE